MSIFKNITNSDLFITDENGIPHRWKAFEQREASNYFYKMTALGGSTDPILALVGQLDDNGRIPSPVNNNDNRLRQPGQANPYLGEAMDAAERRKQLVIDLTKEVGDQRRQISSSFLGIKTPPDFLVDLENIAMNPNNDDDFSLAIASYYDYDDEYGPFKKNGRRATAADAAENPAVREGQYYTGWGAVKTIDASEGNREAVLYFAINNFYDFTVVLPDDYPVGQPVMNGGAIYYEEDNYRIAFDAFNNGSANDTAEILYFKTNRASNESGKLLEALDSAGVDVKDGFYFSPETASGNKASFFLVISNAAYKIDFVGD
jgi:hypothetical protein